MVAWPPIGPEVIFVLSTSSVDTTDTSTAPRVGVARDAMFEKTQLFGVLSHALVVLSTKLVGEPVRAATVAVGVGDPPVQATAGVVPAAKNPEGKLMVMALFTPVLNADVVKATVTALPPGAAAAAVPGTL